MQVEGSSAIVFGGASGLGEATTRRLHEHGARVEIADLNEEKGAALAGELGEEATFAKTDVTSPEEVEGAVAEATQREGGLRINVCCAGVGWAEKVAAQLRTQHEHLARLRDTVSAYQTKLSRQGGRTTEPAATGAAPRAADPARHR